MLSVLLLIGPPVLAEESGPPPVTVLETFACNYNPGKDLGDVLAVRDYYLKQAAKVGFDAPTAYLWSLKVGQPPYDVIWFNLHRDLLAYGENDDAFWASPEMMSAADRFFETVTCDAGAASVTPIFARENGAEGATIVSSLVCGYRGNATGGDLADLRGHMADYLGTLGDEAPGFMAMINPTMGGASTPDVVVFSLFHNMTHWARFVSGLQGSESAASVG